MKVKKTLLALTLAIMVVFSVSSVTDTTYAYWASNVTGNNNTATGTITIGDWAAYPVWDANTSYIAGDIVTYNGMYYEAKKDNIGYEPTITPGWNGRWTEVIVQ
ncbi:MAG: carbohydrate-binding protein [Candidatus Izemoplasma sp.]|nr:carbohydrate-binding protein [Candidatus Izemoplasma sp.]